jgi:hypothetical protein
MIEVRVFESRKVRRTSWRKWEKVAGDRRKLHNEEFVICVARC